MEKVLMNTDNWKTLDACRAGKTEDRDALKNINVTDRHVESTNACVVIRFNIKMLSRPLPAGIYKVISATKYDKLLTELVLEIQPEEQYVDTAWIFPENKTAGSKITIEILPERTAEMSISSAMIQIFKLTGNAYTHGNLAKLAKLNDYWAIYNQGENKPIFMANAAGTVEALIAPFRIN